MGLDKASFGGEYRWVGGRGGASVNISIVFGEKMRGYLRPVRCFACKVGEGLCTGGRRGFNLFGAGAIDGVLEGELRRGMQLLMTWFKTRSLKVKENPITGSGGD